MGWLVSRYGDGSCTYEEWYAESWDQRMRRMTSIKTLELHRSVTPDSHVIMPLHLPLPGGVLRRGVYVAIPGSPIKLGIDHANSPIAGNRGSETPE